MVWIAFLVEEHYATVVKVEGGPYPAVVLYVAPLWPVVVEMLYDHHRSFVATADHRLPVVGNIHSCQLHHLCPVNEYRLAAACLPPLFIGIMLHQHRATPVGQSQVEAPQFTAKPVVCLQRPVGIVGPVLIDHLANKGIVGRRLYAKAHRAVNAAQPYPTASQQIHGREIVLKVEGAILRVRQRILVVVLIGCSVLIHHANGL